MPGYQHILLGKDKNNNNAGLILDQPEKCNALKDHTMLRLVKGLEFDLVSAMRMAAAAEMMTLTSKDDLEGMKAIRESRKPVYGGG